MPAEQPPQPDNVPDPRIAVLIGDVAALGTGVFKCEWVNAAQQPEDINAAGEALLREDPDVGGDETEYLLFRGFNGLGLTNLTPIEDISRIAKGIQEFGDAYAHWIGYHGLYNLDRVKETFERDFIGEFPTAQAVADHLIGATGMDEVLKMIHEQLPESVRPYIQIDRLSFRVDMELGGDVYLYYDADKVFAYYIR